MFLFYQGTGEGSNMITVLLNGGLGNQLFQYATGRALAERHGVGLCLDLSRLEHTISGDTPRSFELAPFGINASVVRDTGRKQAGRYRSIMHRLLLKAGIPSSGSIVLKEQTFRYDPLVLRFPPDCVLDGFWQSERYFTQIASLLRQELRLTEPSTALVDAIAQLSDSTVALHVRRGDYITNPVTAGYHGVCSLEYYRSAVSLVRQQYPDAAIMVFSDDPVWCQEHLDLGQPFILADSFGLSSAAEELQLLSGCAHQVIANSSFSWWGAWLNPSAHKLVIAPSRWFADPAISTSDLFPESWVRLP
jgi:hypothetical protein